MIPIPSERAISHRLATIHSLQTTSDDRQTDRRTTTVPKTSTPYM